MIFRDVTFSEFIGETYGKKVICVGCGELLKQNIEFIEKQLNNQIFMICDNYNYNQEFSYNKKNVFIQHPQHIIEAVTAFPEEYVILITTVYCRSVYEQLIKMLNNIDINIYILPIMSLRVKKYTYNHSNNEQRIPKVIHYFWFGKNQIPEEYQYYIETWKKYCPDYEIVQWNENNYDISKCKYMKQAYDLGKWGFVPDYARLDILYQYGGIYLDTDVELIRSFDDLLYEDAFMGFGRYFNIATGLGFGCRRGNMIIKEMRDMYNTILFENEGVLNLTSSPIYQTAILKKHGLKTNNKYQKIEDMTVFPTDVFDPMGFDNGKVMLTQNTHSIHHFSGSWFDDDFRVIKNSQFNEIKSFF